MNSQHDANLPSEPHWTEGLETDDSDADDSLGSDACMIIQSPTTNPYKNATPILRKATPYTEAEEWLYDLNAEMHAVISLVHCRKRLRNNGPIDSSYQAISLSEEQIHHLARGGILRMNDTEITPANLTTRYELPRQNWECLAATYRQWRLERTQLSPPDHPANFYVSAVAGLDPFLEHSTALLLLHTLEIYIHSALERVGVPAGKPLRIRHFHRALDTIENVFIRSRIPQNFGNKSPLVQRGIILPEPLQQVEKRRIARQLYLDRQFVSNCTGTEFNDIEPDHGVEIIQPTEQLTDIVLTAQQDEVVQGFLALLPWKTQREDSLAILLHGPPGAGKTLLARCIAGAAQRPLIYVEGSIAAENDYEEEVVTVLLQRAAQEQAILFIDEADEIVPNISCANPSLIMHLNNYPAAVILSTNDPHQLDSALYQRLQIKLPLPMPGPNERMRILIRELRIQGYGFSNGLLESPEIARLAQSNRLSGGDWHKVVQSAQIHAALRNRTTTSCITLKDLIKAVGEQTTFKASPTPGKSQYVQWVDYSQPTALLRLSDRLNTEIHEFCSALNTVRTERIDLGLRGIGMCLAISGAERQLIDEVLEQLAHLLCLPVGWLPHDMTHSHEGPAKPRDPEDILFNDSADDENNGGLLYNDDTRKVAYNAATRFGMVNTWFSGEFKQHIIDELGELAIVCLRLPQHADPTLWGGRIDQLVAANHFVVIHQPTGPLLPFLQKRAACCRDWGSVDDSMRKTHWQQIKGQGAAPNVNSLGELAAHAARQHLQKVGLSGDK